CFCLSLEVVGGFLLNKKTAVSSISRETMMQAERLSIESKRNQENKIISNIFEVIQHLLKEF
ncbi:EF0163 family protein, partial [Enterococcus faecalis]